MATIYDVAEFAGVSKSTVSLVLNNSSLVKNATYEKVMAAIKALNYVPNNNAQGLSQKRTNCIGIIIMRDREEPADYDFDRHVGLCSYNITTGIMDTLIKTRYGSLIERFCSVDNPGELPLLIKNRRVDGAVIIGSPFDSVMIAKLKAMNFPFVLAGVDSYAEGVDCVTSDPGEGVRIGLKYLVEKGHKKILFMNCPTMYHSSYVREKSLYQAAAELGITINPEWVVSCGQNNGFGGYEKMNSVLDAGIRPDAVLCANGHIAIGSIRSMNEHGIKVPDDVSVFGYEDSSLCGYCIPALSTVNIHKELIGSTAAEHLVKKLEQNENISCVQVIGADIVIRDSVTERK